MHLGNVCIIIVFIHLCERDLYRKHGLPDAHKFSPVYYKEKLCMIYLVNIMHIANMTECHRLGNSTCLNFRI